MSKLFQDSRHKQIKKIFAQDGTTYVLITCTKPYLEGSMNVEMSHEGDEVLISYLLETACKQMEPG